MDATLTWPGADRYNLRFTNHWKVIMRVYTQFLFAFLVLVAPLAVAESGAPSAEEELLTNTRQITFEGRRAGESYFNPDGTKMVFQSERHEGNPFYQIYLMDLETGDTERVSPGYGKTTCAYIHPDGGKVLFASTQDDPDAVAEQAAELKARAEGNERRYAWDYDTYFDIYVKDLETGTYTNLTKTEGYDAEGAYSPDGEWIVFASNRTAYTEPMTEREENLFEVDKSYFCDIYLMRANGSGLRRLTTHKGYDGGPFFNADGTRICWRRFSEDGATAEIYTMKPDGSDKRQLTSLDAMSWAPYFHPSGEYLIFTTNRHGFENFELYLVDADGAREPVRVTYTPGFDGLPVFFPDGERLAWTSNRTPNDQSQIFFANWNHDAALAKLESSPFREIKSDKGRATLESFLRDLDMAPEIRPEDVRAHVEALASEVMAGRLTGTEGSRLATEYVAAVFDRIGLEPAGDNASYFQSYEFTAGVDLGEDNQLTIAGTDVERVTASEDWRPLSFSNTGDADPAGVVFGGYGIVAPGNGEFADYDSYTHLDVTDKWVMIFRYMPGDWPPAARQHYSRYAALRYKAVAAKDRGARGIIVVSGPNSQVKDELVPLTIDVAISGGQMFAVSVTDAIAQTIVGAADKDLKTLQDEFDTGEMQMGFQIPDVKVGASVNLKKIKRTGRNVLAKLRAIPGYDSNPAVVVGAHVDHLGEGRAGNSLAREDEQGEIHYGADDNASGVAGVLEIAQYLAENVRTGDLEIERDAIFAAWTGEELGLLGSSHYVNKLADLTGDLTNIRPYVAAYINLDMVGRLEDKLVLYGVGSSPYWASEIERRNVPVGLPITVQEQSHVPTDAEAFYLKGVPILFAFTGSHEAYHSPRDTPEKVNYEGTAKISRLLALITRSLLMDDDVPEYVAMKKPEDEVTTGGLRAYLGTVPDYADTDIKGLKLSGVTADAPADKAGLKAGDVIVELAGRTIENIYDYTYAIDALKIGEETPITVVRDGQRIELTITPESRE